MLCSQEANIIPWMLVIKQCDLGNCYAPSLFRQVFFLLNKPLKGLKYNHSQLSAHKFSPSYEFWPFPTTGPCFIPVWFPVHWTKWQSVTRTRDIQGLLRGLLWPGCRVHGWIGAAEKELPQEIGARLWTAFRAPTRILFLSVRKPFE